MSELVLNQPPPTALPPLPPVLPFVLGLANSKGGPGKTTHAVNFACVAEETGEKALVLDCDIAQASASLWGHLRDGAAPLVKPMRANEINKAIAWATRKGFTFVVLDLPGRDGADATSVLSRADFVVVPAQPTLPDLHGSLPTRRALIDLGVPHSVLLNRVRSSTAARARRFRDKYAESGRVLDAMIGERVAFPDAFAAGRSVLEGFGDSARAARGEIRAAYRVMRELAEKPHG